MTIKLVQKVMHYLGRKCFQEAGRNLIVASQSSRGPIQGGRFRNGGSIPSKGRKSTIENHSVRHPGDTFGRIAVPEFGSTKWLKTQKNLFHNSPSNLLEISGRILHNRNSWRNLCQRLISFGSKLSTCDTNHCWCASEGVTWIVEENQLRIRIPIWASQNRSLNLLLTTRHGNASAF